MSNEQGIGAPKGGRVHWLLWCLPPDFKRAYKLYFNYAYHRYCFYRLEKHEIIDVFIVNRTSAHCWRVMYVNTKTGDFQYFSNKYSRHIALRMWTAWQINEKKRKRKRRKGRHITFRKIQVLRNVTAKKQQYNKKNHRFRQNLADFVNFCLFSFLNKSQNQIPKFLYKS